MKRYMLRAGDQTGARGPVYSQTGVSPPPPPYFCALFSPCCFSGFSALSGPAASDYSAYSSRGHLQRGRAPPSCTHSPIQRDGEVGVAPIRMHVQHELTGSKHTLKRIFCVCRGKFGFDLSLPPPLLLFRPLIVRHCDLYQSISCVMLTAWNSNPISPSFLCPLRSLLPSFSAQPAPFCSER